MKSLIFTITAFLLATFPSYAQENTKVKPVELEVLKSYVGVWDAEAEVWPQGLDSPSFKFNGVETNRPFGSYWLASDLEFTGQNVHSIIGYDLDKKKMVGKVIDAGPYAASMVGGFQADENAVHWVTEAKEANGTPMIQKTVVTQKSEDERILVLSVPSGKENEFKKFMRIRFVKRK